MDNIIIPDSLLYFIIFLACIYVLYFIIGKIFQAFVIAIQVVIVLFLIYYVLTNVLNVQIPENIKVPEKFEETNKIINEIIQEDYEIIKNEEWLDQLPTTYRSGSL